MPVIRDPLVAVANISEADASQPSEVRAVTLISAIPEGTQYWDSTPLRWETAGRFRNEVLEPSKNQI